MRFLVGECTTPTLVRTVFRPMDWGRMWVHRTIRLYEGERWGFDNGAFAAFKQGVEWDADKYLTRLDAAYALGTPLVAVVPDRVGAGLEDVAAVLPMFQGVFIGGTTEFKKRAPDFARLARGHGLPCHYGRASSIQRLRFCQDIGVDSCDSTQPLWTKEALARFVRFFEGARQETLGLYHVQG